MKLFQLLIIARVWLRSGLSSAISLVSLTVGLVCATILLLFTVTEYRVALALKGADNTYVLESEEAFSNEAGIFKKETSPDMITQMNGKYPEIEKLAIISWQSGEWQYEDKFDWEGPATIGVSPEFLDLIDIPMIEGDLRTIVASKDQIAITQEYANKIFPGENPIGKTIDNKSYITYKGEGETNLATTYTVTGIIGDMSRTIFKIRGITSIREDFTKINSYSGSYYTLIKLADGVATTTLEAKVAADSLGWNDRNKIRLSPVRESYFGKENPESIFRQRDKNVLFIGLTISLAVLIIAVFNYINISMTRAPRRLKNLAGQRIMGASKKNINYQIFADTALNVLLGFGLSALFMAPAMRAFNSFMGSSLTVMQLFELQNIPYILALLGVLIVLPSINLIYKFKIVNPLEMFKNPRSGKVVAVKTLVIVQFVISIVLIAFSITVARQMDFVVSTINDADKIIYVYDDSNDGTLPKEFVERVKNDHATEGVIGGSYKPNSRNGMPGGKVLMMLFTYPNYFDLFDIKVLQGRVFDSNYVQGVNNVVVNETFLRVFEIEGDPIGQKFEKSTIVGVCEDVMYENAENKIEPVAYRLTPPQFSANGFWAISIKMKGEASQNIERIKNLYKEAGKDPALLKISTVEGLYKEENNEATRLQTMIWIFAGISIFLTVVGLFGLSWYTVERRRKEIAIRKIHGGSTTQMVGLLSVSFMWWVGVAVIVALPIGYYISGYWLDGFSYRVDNSIWVLVITALFAVTITFATVIFQTIRVARAKEAVTIKAE